MKNIKSPVTSQDLAKNAYREQYGIIVICADEKKQRKAYEKLIKQKYKVKVVVT